MTGVGRTFRRVAIVVLACLVVAGGTGAATVRPGSVGGAQQTTRAGDAVDWRYTPLDPRAGETVTLIAPEGGEDRTYAWDLDADGQFEAEGRLVTHVFPEAGDHEVSLRITRADGTTATATKTLAVGPGPTDSGATDEAVTASFVYTPLDPRAGETVTLIAPEDGEDRTYAWDLDADGQFEAEGRLVTHVFPEAGDHEVSLRVAGADGATTTTRKLSVRGGTASTEEGTDGPTIRYTPLEPAPGERITVVAEPAVPIEEVAAVEWTLGGVERRGRIVTHPMPAEGGLTISLTVERTNGTTGTASTTIGGAAATTASSTAVARGTIAGTPTGSPGFGVGAALVAIALVAALRYWRDSDR